MATNDLPLELYADVVAAIAAGKPEDEVLASHGFTEQSFAELEARVEAALSHAMDGDPSESGFLVQYDATMRRAHARATQSAPALSFKDYSRAVAALTSGRDPVKALEAAGLSVVEVVRATQHHAAALAKDAEMVRALQRGVAKTPRVDAAPATNEAAPPADVAEAPKKPEDAP